MLERVLFTEINTRLQQWIANPALLNEIFQPDGATTRVSAAEMTLIRNLFADADKAPRVRHGYPRQLADLPCYSVVLTNERVEQHLLADEVTEDITTRDTQLYGAIENRTYNIYVYALNVDVCYWLYKVLKSLLISILRALASGGMESISWSGGEIEPQPNYLPEIVFIRTLTITGLVEEYYEDPTDLGKVATLGGVFRVGVDSDGDGTVDGGITPTIAPVE